MHKIFSVLVFTVVLNVGKAGTQVDKGSSSRWFKVLTEEESLLREGKAFDRELTGASIKALIWNIKKAEMKDWKDEFLRFGKDRDLILMQEAYGSDRFASTTQSFSGSDWIFGVSFFYCRYGDIPTGTMVGSRVEPTLQLVKHSPDTEPIINTPKSATFAKYPVAGKQEELLVVSVHAINFETSGAFKRHMDQIAEVIKDHVGPVLLAGDFNTWNNSRTLYLSEVAKKLGLSETDYKNGDQRMRFRGFFLDHIFVRGILVKSAEVMGDAQGSDHKPLLLEMSIP